MNYLLNDSYLLYVYIYISWEKIFLSLKSLSLNSKKFLLQKTFFNKGFSTKKAFIILDDSSKTIKKELAYFKKKSFKNFFVLLDKKNISILDSNSSNFFIKPLKIFDLHEEIHRRIKKISVISNKWILDRGNLNFCGNNNEYIQLTEKEYDFLYLLLNNKYSLLEKEYLLKKIWKISSENKTQIRETRVVETLVSRIRKKLNKYDNSPKILKLKGGYKILV